MNFSSTVVKTWLYSLFIAPHHDGSRHKDMPLSLETTRIPCHYGGGFWQSSLRRPDCDPVSQAETPQLRPRNSLVATPIESTMFGSYYIARHSGLRYLNMAQQPTYKTLSDDREPLRLQLLISSAERRHSTKRPPFFPRTPLNKTSSRKTHTRWRREKRGRCTQCQKRPFLCRCLKLNKRKGPSSLVGR